MKLFENGRALFNIKLSNENPIVQSTIEEIIAREYNMKFSPSTIEGSTLKFTVDSSFEKEEFRVKINGEKGFVRTGSKLAMFYAVNEILDNSIFEDNSVSVSDMNVHKDSTGVKYRASNYHYCTSSDGIEALYEHFYECLYSTLRIGSNMFMFARDVVAQMSNTIKYLYFEPLQKYTDHELSDKLIDFYTTIDTIMESLELPYYTSLTEFGIPAEAFEDYPDWEGSRLESGFELQPGLNPCFSHTYTKEHFKAKVREVCELTPASAGIELWMGEKKNSSLYCMCDKCKDISSGERLLSLVNWAQEAMKQVDESKRIIVRSYLCAGRCYHEPEIFLPIADKFPEDILFIVKGQYGDLNYLNDYQPLVGKIPRETIVEFDLGGEYRAFNHGYFSGTVDYVQERMKIYKKQDIAGFAFRNIDWLGNVNFSQAYAAIKMCHDKPLQAIEYEKKYLGRIYGRKASEYLCKLMRIGERICEKDLHIVGLNAFGCFGFFPDTLLRTRYNIFDHCGRMKEGSIERLLECVDSPEIAVNEKEEAKKRADEFSDVLERAKEHLPHKTYQGLKMSASIMQKSIEPHKLLISLFLANMAFEKALCVEDRLRIKYRIMRICQDIRFWINAYGNELQSIDIMKLKEMQGVLSPSYYKYDSKRRFRYLDVKALTKLCDGIENSFEEDWDFFRWNIIYNV